MERKILVVEDEGITALSIMDSLIEMGYHVLSPVFSGEEALAQVEEKRPDLVLMDINLRGQKDGIEAAGHIYTHFNIPVVYLSANMDDKTVKRAKETGPFGFITKPFDNEQLRMSIEIAFYKYEMEEKLRKSEHELKKHKEQLEEIVRDRTSDLISSNELLLDEIHDRRLAEAEAIRACHLAALGELAAGVAHEINNPINGIINYAQLLNNKKVRDDTYEDIAGRIIKESDRIVNIVRSLLSFAREGGDCRETVNIGEVISHAHSLTDYQLRKDDICLTLDIEENLPPVTVQPQQMLQVILNLLSNSRHSFYQSRGETTEKRIVRITAKEQYAHKKRYISISFYDNGSGIAEEIKDKIFNPFFTTKPEGVGTGLGLSISHGIIKKHGGLITIKSEEGRSTEVEIMLPVQ